MSDVYGTDINSSWTFTDGDINLITGASNLGQAISNRLNADTDTYDIFYNRYGGNLFEHLGDINTPNINEYIRIEVESILEQELRIDNVECIIDKNEYGQPIIELKITPKGTDEILPINLVLNDDTTISIEGNLADLGDRS